VHVPTIQVTATNPLGLSASSSVTVTVDQTYWYASVLAQFGHVGIGSLQQFVASQKDQFGDDLPDQPTFTWTVSGGGTVDQTGLFTSTTLGGPYTITATGGGVACTATVHVVPDTTPPAISALTPLATNSLQPVLAVTIQDFASGVDWSTLLVTLDGYDVTQNGGFSYTANGFSYTPPSNLTVGPHTVIIHVSDNHGNWAAPVTWTFYVDTTAPAITNVSPAENALVYVTNEFLPCAHHPSGHHGHRQRRELVQP